MPRSGQPITIGVLTPYAGGFYYGAILAAMCLPLDAYAAEDERFIPDCAGAVAIAHAGVEKVEADGTLILPDGRVRHSVFYSILDSEWQEVKKRLEELMAR